MKIHLVSDQLAISTGLPDQNSFTLALSDHTPEAMGYTDETAQVVATVHLGDQFNNGVPDGTEVFRVQQHVKNDVTSSLFVYRDLLSAFQEEAANLIADLAQAQTDLTVAQTNYNADNTNATLLSALNTLKVEFAAIEEQVKTADKKVITYQKKVDALTGTLVEPNSQDTVLVDLTKFHKTTLTVYIADIYNNRPPSGSVVTLTTENGRLIGTTTANINDSGTGIAHFNFTVGQEKTPNEISSDALYITLETPRGVKNIYEITVNDVAVIN